MLRKNRIVHALVLVMLIAALTVPAAAAEATLRIDAPEQLPAVGETFTVTVSISGNPGLCAAQYTLVFDGAFVVCEEATVGDVLRGTLSATNPAANGGATVAAASISPVRGDGTIGVFTFRVLKSGTAGFTLTGSVFTDANGADVATNIPSSTSGAAQPDATSDEPQEGNEPETPDVPEDGEETPLPTETARRFGDVPPTHWAYADVERAAQLGYVDGVGAGQFQPDRELTRAEFVTMLWRMAGRQTPAGSARFDDVAEGEWYATAVSWAAENGYVKGTSETTFSPNGRLTRQEAVTILFRYSGAQSGAELMFSAIYDSQFTDSGSIADWAKSAMYWAVYNGVMNGTSETTVSPLGTATRAQIATILVRYSSK